MLPTCMGDNPLAKALGLSLRAGGQTMIFRNILTLFSYFDEVVVDLLQFAMPSVSIPTFEVL